MRFFEEQRKARNRSALLVVLFVLAVLAILAMVNFVIFIFFGAFPMDAGARDGFSSIQWENFAPISAATLAFVGIGSLYKIMKLGRGGSEVASIVGARRVSFGTQDPNEKLLLNVVEEMAIASGVSVPATYLMDREKGINAFAAGYHPNQAIIAVTKGCLDNLDREELQAVVAHEFSHILNGDMRLNIRLLGALHGIILLTVTGRQLIRVVGRSRGSSRKGDSRGALILFGLALILIGWIGVFFGRLIKSAVSRQREFLADASAVQFTRNPDGLGSALLKIKTAYSGSIIVHAHAEELSHMFFGSALRSSFFGLLATHPPMDERIRALKVNTPELLKKIAMDRKRREIKPVYSEEVIAGVRAPFESVQQEGTSAPKPDARMEALLATQVISEQILQSAGNPELHHLTHAQNLIRNLPDSVVEALRSTETVEPILTALILLDESPQSGAGWKHIRENRDWEFLNSTETFYHQLKSFRAHRLEVIDLVAPRLNEKPPEVRREVVRSIRKLIWADQRLSLFELALITLIEKQLDFRRAHTARGRAKRLSQVFTPLQILMSALARASDARPEQIQADYENGMKQLFRHPPQLAPALRCQPENLKGALEQVLGLPMPLKERVLKAALTVIHPNSVTNSSQWEILRAFAAALDVPLPPIMPDSLRTAEQRTQPDAANSSRRHNDRGQ